MADREVFLSQEHVLALRRQQTQAALSVLVVVVVLD